MATPLSRSVTITAGDSKLQVSPICVGMTGDPDTVIAAWDAGINFFFLTADMHWPLYEKTRQGLVNLAKARPDAVDQVVIAGCCYTAQPEFQEAPFREVLDVISPFTKIDILVAGGSYKADIKTRLETLRKNVKRGVAKARAIATSLHDRKGGIDVVNEGLADLVFVRYNAQHPGAQLDFFPHLSPTRTTKIFNFKSTSAFQLPDEFKKMGADPELWFPSVTDHYRFVMCRPELDGLLTAPQTPKQLEGLVEAYQAGPLPSDEESHLLALAKLILDDRMSKKATAGGAG